MQNPTVFISYSWDSEPHKRWVLALANRLLADGIDVKLDRYELKYGGNLTMFIENAINGSDRIIIIFTPNYKLKADNRHGGVGYEYSIMNTHTYSNIATQHKIIPVLRAGNTHESIPDFMKQFIYLDLSNDEYFEDYYNELLREIYNEPIIKKPAIGKKPDFTSKGTEGDSQSAKAEPLPTPKSLLNHLKAVPLKPEAVKTTTTPVFEPKFTPRVKEVIQYSREEAIGLGHDYLGTEHLLLGLIKDGSGEAISILKLLNVDLSKLRSTIYDVIKDTKGIKVTGDIPLTKQAEKVLKITYLEAKLLMNDVIGTDHLVLSMLRDEDNIAAQILLMFKVNYEVFKAKLEETQH